MASIDSSAAVGNDRWPPQLTYPDEVNAEIPQKQSAAPAATENSVWAIVVAAGSGSRFGGPKQFVDLCGVPVLTRSVHTASDVCDGVVVVVPGTEVADAESQLAATFSSDLGAKRIVVVAGGDTRSASVRCGLANLPDGATHVLVHDGARPLASRALYTAIIDRLLDGEIGVIPCIPVVDSLRWREGGAIDRNAVVAVQTPQGFDAAILRSVHQQGSEWTDDAGLVEADGHKLAIVDGEETNLKITHPFDIDTARRHIEQTGDTSADERSTSKDRDRSTK